MSHFHPFSSSFPYSLRGTWRLIILVLGITVVLLGIVLFFIPGPGLLVLIFGLVILSSEFVWARRLLRRVKNKARVATRFAAKRGKKIAKELLEST